MLLAAEVALDYEIRDSLVVFLSMHLALFGAGIASNSSQILPYLSLLCITVMKKLSSEGIRGLSQRRAHATASE